MKGISAVSLFAVALLGGTAVAHACDWDDDAGYRTTRIYRYAPAYSYRSYAYSPTYYYDDDYYYAYGPSYYAYAPRPYLYTSFGFWDGGRRHRRAYQSETRSVNFTTTVRNAPARQHHRR